MWRGTAIFGNRTRLGRGKRGMSINSYEEFFVLPCLIYGAAVSSKKESTETTAQSLRQCCNFAGGPYDGILDDVGRLIDPVHQVMADAVESGKLDVQSFTSVCDHCFNAAELIAGRYSDLDEIRRSNTEIFSDRPDRHHHFARLSHEALDLIG